MDEHSLKEIIQFSKENPDQIYTSDDGRVVANGKVFKNKEEFEFVMKTALKMGNLKNKIKNIFKPNKSKTATTKMM